MLGQRRRRWADVVQLLYKWSVFAGLEASQRISIIAIWLRSLYLFQRFLEV